MMVLQEPPDSPRRWCYGCGEANPEGLRIKFRVEGAAVVGDFRARPLHQGFPGLVHGGITAAALDEAMGWAMFAAGIWGVTAKMEVKYRRSLPLDQELTVRGKVTRDRGRRLEVEAQLHNEEGQLLAEATAVFMRINEGRARQLTGFYLGRTEGQSAAGETI